jgi:hypothetical protein
MLRPAFRGERSLVRNARQGDGDKIVARATESVKINFNSFGTSGSVTRSSATSAHLNASARGSITASLTSGLPGDTWTSAPLAGAADNVRGWLRGPHAMIAFGSLGSPDWRRARRLSARESQRADVEAGGAVFDEARADAEQVEDAEINVEALVALAGKHGDVARQRLDAPAQPAVVRRRARSDVGRRHRQAAGELRHRARPARPVDTRQPVELADVQVR